MAYPTDVSMKAVPYLMMRSNKKIQGRASKGYKRCCFRCCHGAYWYYSSSILGGITNDVLGGGVTKGRASHVFAMRDIVANTAQGYILSG